MDIKNNVNQTQLLQRNLPQLSQKASVQEKPVERQREKSSTEEVLNSITEKEKVKQMTDSLNEFIMPLQTSLKFEFHEKLEEYYVTIIDFQTKEVIKEIPSKKMLDLYASIAESLGLIVDHKI